MGRQALCLALAAGLVSLGACAPAPRAPAPAECAAPPVDFPENLYLRAAARGEPVYRVAPERSQVVIQVFRAGPLANLGHDHVVSSRAVYGYVLRAHDPTAARADLYLDLHALRVDPPELRGRRGLDKELPDVAVAATRRNMLDKVLEVERYPFVRLRIHGARAEPPGLVLRTGLRLHGTMRRRALRVRLHADAQALSAWGGFELSQRDFGITPFSALGGALRVDDRLEIDFDIRAVRVRPRDGGRRIAAAPGCAGGRGAFRGGRRPYYNDVTATISSTGG